MLRGFETDLVKYRKVPVIVLPEIIETGPLPCDVGSPPEKLLDEFGKHHCLDFTRCPHGWNEKTGLWAPEPTALTERARVARQFLRSRSEREIIVVSHFGFLSYMIGRRPPEGWDNCERRIHRFKHADDHEAVFVAEADIIDHVEPTTKGNRPLASVRL